MAGPQDYAATAAAVAAANKKAASTPTKTTTPTKSTTPTKAATPTKTTAAPTSGALPSSFTPYLTPTVTMGNATGAFIGPIPGDSIRTTTGYTYPTAEIWDAQFNTLVTVFTSGPNAGKTADGRLVIQGTKPTGNGNGGGGGGGDTGVSTTTARSLLEAQLRDLGIPDNMIQSSVSFMEALDAAGIKDADERASIYMNNKNFTTKDGTVLTSPFYTRYTSLVEGVKNPTTGLPYTAKDAFAWRVGIEQAVSNFGLSQQFASDETLKKFAQNNVSVKNFTDRAQAAALATTEADPFKVAALRKMGYINSSQDLKDFYLNADIGQKQFEENQRIGAFATEAARFGNKGIVFNADRIKQIAAGYGNLTEGQASQQALGLYQNVAGSLQQTVALTGIYEKPNQTGAQMTEGIQTELENATIYGTEAERAKRLAEQNIKAFEARSGQSGTAMATKGITGLI